MILIVGLGNPGTKFKNTRHNVGFMAVDKVAGNFQFPDFKFNKKINAEISESEIDGQKTILAKPQTFMNESGKAVRALTKPYTLDPKSSIIVIHDDIDLPVGKIKIVKDRGSAGHKGVESIIQAIGNEDLIRIRIGIGPEKNIKADKIVLKNFSAEEREIIDQVISKTAEAVEVLIKSGLEKAMTQFN